MREPRALRVLQSRGRGQRKIRGIESNSDLLEVGLVLARSVPVGVVEMKLLRFARDEPAPGRIARPELAGGVRLGERVQTVGLGHRLLEAVRLGEPVGVAS